MRPDVGRVVGDEDRHVADDADTLRVGVFPQPVPLAEEEELGEIGDVQSSWPSRTERMPARLPCEVGNGPAIRANSRRQALVSGP